MTPLDKALEDIGEIRAQLAEGALFRGFGPAVTALTGAAALATAGAQTLLPDLLAGSVEVFLLGWILTALVCGALAAAEMAARTKRLHGGMADAMLLNAAESFLPAALAGAAIAVIFFRFAPQALWALPGLWQMLFALGLFASARMLPRPIRLVAAWYFVVGAGVLIYGARESAAVLQEIAFRETVLPGSPPWIPDPWMMGAPFAVGQFAMAAVLKAASGGRDG